MYYEDRADIQSKNMTKQIIISEVVVSYDIRRTDSPHNATLVLLHGWGGSKESWKNNIPTFSKYFNCVALDLPGFGESEEPNKPWDTLEYTNFVKEFIKVLKIQSPVIVGKSFGGRIAIMFASKWPKEVSRLILVSSAGLEGKTTSLQLKIRVIKLFGLVVSLIPGLDEEVIRRKVYKFLALKEEGTYKREVKKLVTNQDLRGMLQSIEAKTLVVWGDNDTVLPLSVGKKLSAGIKNSKLEIIKNGDHWVHEKHAEEFNQRVIDFLR
jgi:pimeloyl-ACP methyl ester carboxylesterase